MKKFLLILLVVIQQSFSQSNLEITYSIKYNTSFYNEKIGTLFIDVKNEKTLFNISKNIIQEEIKNEDEKQINLTQSYYHRYIYTNFKSDSLSFNEKIHNKEYEIKEIVPKFDWVLSEETKKIGEYNCKKATTYFRGRKFIAWYAEEYPLKMGPWKFSGLPGLIMEVYDETIKFYWGITSIKNTDATFTEPISKTAIETIDIKKYVYLIYDTFQETDNSDLPRGVEVINKKLQRTRLETKFEWEN